MNAIFRINSTARIHVKTVHQLFVHTYKHCNLTFKAQTVITIKSYRKWYIWTEYVNSRRQTFSYGRSHSFPKITSLHTACTRPAHSLQSRLVSLEIQYKRCHTNMITSLANSTWIVFSNHNRHR